MQRHILLLKETALFFMVIDKFIGLGSRADRRSFTLIELLVVITIISLLVGGSIAAINAVSGGQSMGQVSGTIAATLERARTTAMAHNTYVWVGFSGNTTSGLVIAAVESTTGQASDLSSSAYLQPIMKPVFVPNVNLSSISSLNTTSATSVSNMANTTIGMDTNTSDYFEVTSSTIGNFTASVSGVSTTFSQIIQFNSQGETLVQSSLVKWVNLGLVPIHGKSTNVADIQVSGTTGEVRLFQP